MSATSKAATFSHGDVDVIVCDGFIGNIALKISEGLVEHVGGMLKKASRAASRRRSVTFSRSRPSRVSEADRLFGNGGAPLLGVRGITIIGHGRSNAVAIKNAIRVATELCRTRFNEKIEQELSASAVASRGFLKGS